ncbi:MAG: TIM barrel protein [Oscillospiraceae bacterium]|nr:TIM barrel protein [Oscillospiraceae bacterium]
MIGIGIGSYSYPQAIRAAQAGLAERVTPLMLAERTALLGVNTLQICDNLPLTDCSDTELVELAHFCAENGIAVEVGTSGIGAEEIEAWAAIGSKLRARILRALLPAGLNVEELIIRLLRLQPVLEEAGLMLAVENYERYSLTDYAQVLQALPEEYYGLCLDTANNLARGETPEQYVMELGTRICCVHIKDVAARRLPSTFGFVVEGVPAGCGIVDIPGLLAKTERAAKNYTVILEQWPPELETLTETLAQEARWVEQGIRCLQRLTGAFAAGD